MNIKETDRSKGYLRMAECVADYTFNKTDTFSGVQFVKGAIYEVNIHNVIDYDLYCVYKDEVPIGISKHTFNQHFKMKEKTND